MLKDFKLALKVFGLNDSSWWYYLLASVALYCFYWGADKIAEWAEEGNFDYLAANIEKDGKPVDWAKPYMIQEIAGKKIAFIGLAHPNTPTLTKASNIEGLTFTDPIEAANKWVKFLEDGEAEEGKVDAIVLLTHIDSSQDKETNEITGTAVDLAEQVKDIDLILSAHSHRTVNGIVNDVPIIQASKYGRAIGVVDMVFDENDKPEITCEVFQGKDIKDDLIDDEEQVQVRNDLEEELAPIKNEVLGVATEDISHSRDSKGSNTPLGHWTCEVMAKKTGAQIGIQNGGGSFVYCELMENANALISIIESATKENIDDIKAEIYADDRILPYITSDELKGLEEEFEKMDLNEKKKALISLVDKNKLYVNYSDIDDTYYEVSEEDKAFTRSFYEEV